ncbi:MAG: hypothetical protein WA783_13740 [Phormidesmis sp.]
MVRLQRCINQPVHGALVHIRDSADIGILILALKISRFKLRSLEQNLSYRLRLHQDLCW